MPPFNQPLNDWRRRQCNGYALDVRVLRQLGDWRVDKVTDMSWMFCNASTFNQPLPTGGSTM